MGNFLFENDYKLEQVKILYKSRKPFTRREPKFETFQIKQPVILNPKNHKKEYLYNDYK